MERNNPIVTALQYLISLSDDELKAAKDVWMRGGGKVLVIANTDFLVMCNVDADNALLETIHVQNRNQEWLDPTPALHDILQNHGTFFASVPARLKEIREILLDNGSVRFSEQYLY